VNPPLIGLSTYCEPARWGPWDQPAALLPANYIAQVRRAGAVPLLIPPIPGLAGAAVGRLDGLILTGGGDLDPGRYGAVPDPRTTRVTPERDASEFELLAAALAAGLPVLGICRGLQILNVARGGTLCQHLAEEGGHAAQPGSFGTHKVRMAAGSRLAGIVGDGWLDVPTSHHQGIERPGDGLVATAWAADGVIEAVELPPGEGRHPFVVAVQWHPEASGDERLVEALAAAAGGG
jgi:putative glutamine amidotransferase